LKDPFKDPYKDPFKDPFKDLTHLRALRLCMRKSLGMGKTQTFKDHARTFQDHVRTHLRAWRLCVCGKVCVCHVASIRVCVRVCERERVCVYATSHLAFSFNPVCVWV
jgi:hypothetical protein